MSTSWVWSYFERPVDDKEHVICKVCALVASALLNLFCP